MTSLSGLGNLTSIAEDITISENPVLTSLTGLDNLASIGEGILISYNNALTNLTSLNNIDASTINWLYIFANPLLSSCEAKSICEYLISSTGYIEIGNNAPGCNSKAEVQEDCEDLSVKEYYSDDYLSLYPNAAHQEVNISTDDGKEIEEVRIYTLTGQRVLNEIHAKGMLDISSLQTGMYIVEVTIENARIMKKLLVQR